MDSKGRPAVSSLSSRLSSGGTLPAPMHLTLVVRKNSSTASVALPSHSRPTEGVHSRFPSHAFPIAFYSLLRCGAHTWHLMKMLCRDWASPLTHHQHSFVSDFSNRWR